jgi:DNA-binding IclR family transcriptional regulator
MILQSSREQTSLARYRVLAGGGCGVLFSLAAESPRMSLREIASRVGIHTSKAFSIVLTLQKCGRAQMSER